jgi:biuret amidohydrolase
VSSTDLVGSTGLVAGTTPYPWPYDGALSRGRIAVVVLGWNDDWWNRCAEPATVVAAIRSLAAMTDCVITVDQPPPPVHGAVGAPPVGGARPELARPELARPELDNAHVVSAVGVDGFFGGPLDSVLRANHRDLIVLVGLGLEAAVHSTMRSANDRGYECLLVVDACAALDLELVPAAVSMVEMSGGIFGAVGTAAQVLAALEHLAANDRDPDLEPGLQTLPVNPYRP